MAANDSNFHEDDQPTQRDQAATAGHDDGNRDNSPGDPPKIDPAEFARLQKALAETNRKAKADRLRVEEFEKAQREAEEAKLGEGDRLKRERDAIASERQKAMNEARAAREELDRVRLDFEIERMAGPNGFNFAYPETAAKLIDRDLIEYDEDTGKPLNLKEVLKKLAEKFPNLVNSTPARPGTPPRAGQAARQVQPTDPRSEQLSIIDDLRRKVHYPGR